MQLWNYKSSLQHKNLNPRILWDWLHCVRAVRENSGNTNRNLKILERCLITLSTSMSSRGQGSILSTQWWQLSFICDSTSNWLLVSLGTVHMCCIDIPRGKHITQKKKYIFKRILKIVCILWPLQMSWITHEAFCMRSRDLPSPPRLMASPVFRLCLGHLFYQNLYQWDRGKSEKQIYSSYLKVQIRMLSLHYAQKSKFF